MVSNKQNFKIKKFLEPANFCSHKKTAQWRLNLKSFENFNYLKFIEHTVD